MGLFFIETQNLEILSIINKQLKNDAKIPFIQVFNNQINSLSIEDLIQLEDVKEGFIFLLQKQNITSEYIIQNLLCGFISKINLPKSSSVNYLPQHIFTIFPQINKKIFILEDAQDLLGTELFEHQTIFSKIYLESNKKNIFLSSRNFIKPFNSICSIKKIMQYFAYRFIRDIPND